MKLECQASQFPSAHEDSGEHDGVEPSGVGVAQRWMIAGKQVQSVRQLVLDRMTETVCGFSGDDSGVEQISQVAIEGNLAEADDDPDTRQGLHLVGEVLGTVTDLLRERLISGRGTAYDRGYPGMTELEAIVAGDRFGFTGKAEVVKNWIHEVAGSVTGERTAGSIGTMSAGSESKDQDTGARIAESGDRTRPVGLVLIRAATSFTKTAAVVAQPRATLAGDDGISDLLEELGCRLDNGAIHTFNHIG